MNHRIVNGEVLWFINAVSERLFSAAIACITSSDSHSVRGHTAAGFPEKSLSVKASTWYMGILNKVFSISFDSKDGFTALVTISFN